MPLISFTCRMPAEILGDVSGAALHDASSVDGCPRGPDGRKFGPTKSGPKASTPKTAAGAAAAGIPAPREIPGTRAAGGGGGGGAGGGARLAADGAPVMGLGLEVEGGCQHECD